MSKTITKEQLDYIRSNWGALTIDQLTENLGISEYMLRKYVEEMNLGKIRESHEWTEEELEYLKENCGKKSIREISRNLSLSDYVVKKQVNKMGLEDRRIIHKWTEEETTYLKENWEAITATELSRTLDIDEREVRRQAKRLGLEIMPLGYRWTEEELKYLKENWKVKTEKEIAKKLNISVVTVKKQAEKMGLGKLQKNHEWTEEEINYLKEKYNTLSEKKMAQKLKVSEYQVGRKLRSMGLYQTERYHKWTEEETNYLKENWKKKSVSEICRYLKISRNVAMKKAALLGLPKPNRKIKWTDKKINKLRELAKTMNALELAAYFKSTDTAIRAIASTYGIKLKTRQPWTDEDTETLRELSKTMNMDQIAQKMGRDIAVVSRKAKKYGIELKKNKTVWTDEDIEKLQELVKEGKSVVQITIIMGKNEQTVAKKVRDLGLTVTNVETRHWTEEEIQRLILLSKTKKLSELVIEFERSTAGIRNQCRILGIEPITDRKKWTTEEIEDLKKLYTVDKKTIKEIAVILNRTELSVNKKIVNLKLKPVNKSCWTEEEEELLADLWGYRTTELIASKLNRSTTSVRNKAYLLGLDASFNSNYNVLKLKDLSELFDIDRRIIDVEWMALGLKVRTVRTSNCQVYKCVEIESLLEFLKQYQDIWDSRALEKNVLGEEPEWLLEKRKKDLELALDRSEFRAKAKQLLIEARKFCVEQKESIEGEPQVEDPGFRKKFTT